MTAPAGTARLKRYAPGSALPGHVHQTPRLCFVLRGAFEEGISDERSRRERRQLLFRPAGLRHDEGFGAQGALCGLADPGADWTAMASDCGLRVDRPLAADGADAQRLGEAFQRELTFGDSFSRLSLQALLWEATALLGRADKSPATQGSIWAGRAEAYLRAHCGEPIGLGDVARALGLHPGHLARTFRASLGETLGARLRRIRAQRAADLIRRTATPLIEVAAECGFAHQAHMTRVFRAMFGVTPGRYRRQTR
jgi:AraC family transcriptional regulator